MTREDLDLIRVGDSVLAAFGRMDEHTVVRLEPVRVAHARSKFPTAYRTALLTREDGLVSTNLVEGGPEVVIHRNTHSATQH